VVNRAGRARSTVDRWQRGPKASEHSDALTGVRPPAAPVHQSSPVGHKRERGAQGSRLGPHRSSGGGVAIRRRGGAKRSREARWGGVPARERRREGLGEVWGAPGVVGVAFIGLEEGAGGWPK
jgi:hypothetical protein